MDHPNSSPKEMIDFFRHTPKKSKSLKFALRTKQQQNLENMKAFTNKLF